MKNWNLKKYLSNPFQCKIFQEKDRIIFFKHNRSWSQTLWCFTVCQLAFWIKFQIHNKYTPIQYKRYYLWVWPFYDHFWSFFGKLHEYLSQNLVTGGHFEVLKLSKSQLDQKLQQKTEVLLFPFFFQFWKKKSWKFMTLKMAIFDNFWSFFCQLHENISQIWSSEGHFEVLSMFKS